MLLDLEIYYPPFRGDFLLILRLIIKIARTFTVKPPDVVTCVQSLVSASPPAPLLRTNLREFWEDKSFFILALSGS